MAEVGCRSAGQEEDLVEGILTASEGMGCSNHQSVAWLGQGDIVVATWSSPREPHSRGEP